MNSAQLNGIADALLARILSQATGLNPTTPEAVAVQAGSTPERAAETVADMLPGGSTDRLATVFSSFAVSVGDKLADVLRLKLATVSAPVDRRNPDLEAAFASPTPPSRPAAVDLRRNPDLDAVFGGAPSPVRAPLYATREQERADAASATAAALSGAVSPVTARPPVSGSTSPPAPPSPVQPSPVQPSPVQPVGSQNSQFAELIQAIRDAVRRDDAKSSPDSISPNYGNASTGGGDGESKEALKSLSMVAQTVLKTLIPISIAATVLGSATSGFNTFLSSFKVLGSIVGSVLTPAFLLGGAVVISLADIIADNLIPNLEKWYTTLTVNGIKAIQWLQDAIISLANEILKSVPRIQSFSATLLENVNRFALMGAKVTTVGKGLGIATQADIDGFNDIAKESANIALAIRNAIAEGGKSQLLKSMNLLEGVGIKLNEKGEPQIPKFNVGDGIAGRVPDNFRLMVDQFRFDNAPKPQSSGLVQAASNAQLAALSPDPFKTRMERDVQRVIQTLEKIADQIKPPTGR